MFLFSVKDNSSLLQLGSYFKSFAHNLYLFLITVHTKVIAQIWKHATSRTTMTEPGTRPVSCHGCLRQIVVVIILLDLFKNGSFGFFSALLPCNILEINLECNEYNAIITNRDFP